MYPHEPPPKLDIDFEDQRPTYSVRPPTGSASARSSRSRKKQPLDPKFCDSPYLDPPVSVFPYPPPVPKARSMSARRSGTSDKISFSPRYARTPMHPQKIKQDSFPYPNRIKLIQTKEREFFDGMKRKYNAKSSDFPYHVDMMSFRSKSVDKSQVLRQKRYINDSKKRRIEVQENIIAVSREGNKIKCRGDEIFSRKATSLRIIPSTDRRNRAENEDRLYI